MFMGFAAVLVLELQEALSSFFLVQETEAFEAEVFPHSIVCVFCLCRCSYASLHLLFGQLTMFFTLATLAVLASRTG